MTTLPILGTHLGICLVQRLFLWHLQLVMRRGDERHNTKSRNYFCNLNKTLLTARKLSSTKIVQFYTRMKLQCQCEEINILSIKYRNDWKIKIMPFRQFIIDCQFLLFEYSCCFFERQRKIENEFSLILHHIER